MRSNQSLKLTLPAERFFAPESFLHGPGTERRLRGGCHYDWDLRVIAETEREKGKKALLALASERRAA